MSKENIKEIEQAEKVNEKVIEINEKINLRIGIKEASTKRFKKTLKEFNQEFNCNLSEEEIEKELSKMLLELSSETSTLERKIKEIEEMYSNENVDLEEVIEKSEEPNIKEIKDEVMNANKVSFNLKEKQNNIKPTDNDGKEDIEDKEEINESFGDDFGNDFGNDFEEARREEGEVCKLARVLGSMVNIK